MTNIYVHDLYPSWSWPSSGGQDSIGKRTVLGYAFSPVFEFWFKFSLPDGVVFIAPSAKEEREEQKRASDWSKKISVSSDFCLCLIFYLSFFLSSRLQFPFPIPDVIR